MPKKASKKKLGYSIFTDPEFMEKYRDLVLMLDLNFHLVGTSVGSNNNSLNAKVKSSL